MATLTINSIPVEDLQRAKDVHLDGRTKHHLYKPPQAKGGETRGRKGTGGVKVYHSAAVEVGGARVIVRPRINGSTISYDLEVV